MQTNDFSNLPTSWQIKTLGEIAQTTSGGTPSRKKLDYWNGNIKWLKSGELNDNYINEVEETITQSGLENSSAKIFSKGTLLIALYGATIGKLGILNLETSTNQAVCAIMPNKELETKYLFHFLFSIRNKMIKDAFGGAQSNISQTYLKQIKIPLPPLEIQKRIVARLESAFEKIEKGSAHLQDAKTKLAKYKQSLLKSAFNGALTATASLRESAADEAIHKVDCHKSANANFHNDDKSVDCHDLTSSKLAMTDKENPKLPQGWTIKTLGEIAQTTSGGTPSRKKLDYWNGNIKWLKSGELNDNYINEVEETITQSGLENSSAKIFSKGTLLIALYGATIGKLGILNLETSTNQAVCAIMPNKELETKYLFHFLFSIRNKMIKDAFGGAQSNISQTYLKQIKIPLPPLETQKQIVKLLEKHLQHANKTGEFIESALNKAKQLKQSLLKSAFLGELV